MAFFRLRVEIDLCTCHAIQRGLRNHYFLAQKQVAVQSKKFDNPQGKFVDISKYISLYFFFKCKKEQCEKVIFVTEEAANVFPVVQCHFTFPKNCMCVISGTISRSYFPFLFLPASVIYESHIFFLGNYWKQKKSEGVKSANGKTKNA